MDLGHFCRPPTAHLMLTHTATSLPPIMHHDNHIQRVNKSESPLARFARFWGLIKKVNVRKAARKTKFDADCWGLSELGSSPRSDFLLD